MSANTSNTLSAVSSSQNTLPQGKERRARWRAKVIGSVLIRGGMGTHQLFEDVGKSVDVTRDGLLIRTRRGGYWVEQALEVTFPYWESPGAINVARTAMVVRSALLPDMHFAVAVQFRAETRNHAWNWNATPYPHQVLVLGVESDPQVARAVRELLEQDGYRVLIAATAQEALEVLRVEKPDVLLAEAEGNEISGRDLCVIVKTSPRLRHIPVILTTTSALPSDYAAGHKLGAIICMMRPCHPERLRRAVHLVAPPPAQQSVYSAGFSITPLLRTV
jgi:CheY-like chemotaxis protein